MFLLDPAPESRPGKFPTSWNDKLRSHAKFASERTDVASVLSGTDAEALRNALHRRLALRETPSARTVSSLLDFAVERFNDAFWHFTDPCEHCPSGKSSLDPLAPFEFGLTVDRLLRKGLLCTFGTDEIDRKDDSFECADLVAELVEQRNGNNAGSVIFKNLFTRSFGTALASDCLKDAPPDVRSLLLDRVNAAYDALVQGIEESITIKSKLSVNGVAVRNKNRTQEVIEPLEQFAANILRAMRNAHHGYLTSNDERARPARYLSLVDGSIPNAVTFLGSFWALCALIAPQTLFKRDWMAIGRYAL